MSNILEYTLQLRDLMSTHLKTIGVTSDSTMRRFENLEREAREVSQELTITGRSVGALKRQLDVLRQSRDWIPSSEINKLKEANKEIRNLEKEINKIESKGSGWFSDAINSIPFANVLTNPFVIAGTVAGAAIKNGIQNDLSKTSFEVFLGSEQAAEQMMEDLGKIKMDKNVLAKNAQLMLSFDLQEEKVLPVLSAIGDISSGSADKMGSLTRAFSQMSSLGKLQAEDLNQMIDAGYNPLTEMSRTTGKSVMQLREEMAKGSISAKMVEDAFISSTQKGGLYHGMLEKNAQTLGGKLNEEMRKMNDRLLTMYGYLEPVVSKLIELGGAALDATFNGLGWLIDKFEEGSPVIWGITIALGAYTAGMILANTWTKIQAGWNLITTGQLWAQVTAWWGLNSAMYANPIGLIIAGVIALAALIGVLIYKVDGWGEAWEHTVKAVSALWDGFTNHLKLGWLVAENFIMSGIDKIMVAWYKLKSLWDEESANNALDQINQRSEERKRAILNTSKEIAKNTAEAWQSTKNAGNSLSWNDKGFEDIKNDIKSRLGIVDPSGSIPGVSTNGGVTTNLASGGNGGASKSNNAIATGGTKHNYITITMDKLVETINVHAQNMREGADKAAEMTQDALLRILASAETAAS